MQEVWVQSLGQEDPLEEEMATYSCILAWKFHGQRSLVGYSPGAIKSQHNWPLWAYMLGWVWLFVTPVD